MRRTATAPRRLRSGQPSDARNGAGADEITLRHVGALIENVRTVRQGLESAGSVVAPDGQTGPLSPVAIGPLEAAALRAWVVREAATRTFETGLGFGISALSICEGLLTNGGDALHVAADPFQMTGLPSHDTIYAGVGLKLLDDAGVRDLVEFFEEGSEIVLPRLLAEGRRFHLAFIDGNHRFEGVFTDLIYAGRLLNEGIVFVDDTQLPAVRSAVSFCESNLGWTQQDEGREDDQHHWVVLRTGPHPRYHRAYDDYVAF
jgi:predicted O-methyltransferase YrrM